MKRILKLPTLLFLALAALFFTSCEDDTPGEVGPSVTLTSSSEITVNPEEVFTVTFTASRSDDAPLQAVTVTQDGSNVENARLTYNGTAASANPALLFDDDKEDLSWSIDIVAQSAAATTATYAIIVQDEDLETQSVSIAVTTSGVPPTLTTDAPSNIVTDQDVKNLFSLSATQGTGALSTIEVRLDQTRLDVSNIFWQEISMSVVDNPFTLSEDLRGGFTDQELYIMTPAMAGTFSYDVILTDEFGLSDTLNFEVVTNPQTAIEMREDILLNAGGGQGTGGLDLDTGMSTNSTNVPDSEIRDNGINIDLPPENNWLRTISPMTENGVDMRYLIAGENGLSEGFTFGSVQFKEDLAGLYENGVPLLDGSTERVNPGDIFIVNRDDRYWVLEVIEVSTNLDDNSDQYTFDVKF